MLTVALVLCCPLSLIALPQPVGLIACCCGIVAIFLLESGRDHDEDKARKKASIDAWTTVQARAITQVEAGSRR